MIKSQTAVVKLAKRLNCARAKIARTQILKEKVDSAVLLERELSQRRIFSQYQTSVSNDRKRFSVDLIKRREKQNTELRRSFY